MNFLLLICIYLLLVYKDIHATDKKWQTDENRRPIAISSVAGVFARNGMFSSLGGIQSIKPFSSLRQQNILNLNRDSKNMATRYVKIPTGVMAIVSAARIDDKLQEQTTLPTLPIQGALNQLLTSNVLSRQHYIDQWLHKEMFRNLLPNMQMKDTWLYPTFSPFINY